MNDFDSDDLPAKLRAWTVAPKVPGSFSREVWRRIALRQAAREEAVWPRLTAWVTAQLFRPRYALALILVSLSASLSIAHVQAREANAKLEKVLEARYAASVDPLAMSR